MAVIKKYAEVLTQNLTSFGTFIIDTNPNSQYFKITEFKDTFTGGKNGFLIEGSEHLKETTEIKIQILDVNGDPIYYEPGNGIPEYYEGVSKLVAVYVYEDTPIGEAKITILGELKTYVDEGGVVRDVPDEWKGVYNLKWEKTFKVNKLLSNEDKVRFYRRPEISITEIVKPIYSNLVKTITQTGNVNGTPQIPSEGQSVTGFTLPTSYLLTTVGNSFWTGSVTNNYITLTNKGVSLLADDIINDRELTVSTPYNEGGIVKSLTNEPYSVTFNYVEGVDNLKTALTGSFAKITISDLTTFVGDVARVKVFRRSQSDLSDYQFIQEIQLESNELLTDLESKTKNQEYYGSFDLFNYKSYWCTSSNNLTTQFNQDYLYNSVKLNSVAGTNNFFTTKSLDVTKDTEYTLNFNAKVGSPIDTNDTLVVYLSGSRASTYNNVTTTVGRTQNILSLKSDSSLLQKSQITANFKAEELADTRLFFEVNGNDWYISDVSLRASQETSFSPDEITFIQPIPRTLPAETFEFLFQFYDINNNYIPVTVTETKTFDGGNLNFINKDLQLIPSSLYFQFDSGSGNGNPIPPTQIFIDVVKSYLTGSVNFTSRSFDFFNNELFNTDYVGVGTQYPGFLLDRNLDTVRLTVENFTGSKIDGRVVQYIEFTGECEGVTDSIVITRVTDGKGGVNHIIRPYRGTQIRNSSTASLEIQAVRIDGINEIELSKNAQYNWSDIQLHVLSASLNPSTEPEKFINLTLASSSKYVKGLITGSLGSREINHNAVFDRDSIDTRRIIYLMSSASAAGGYAYEVSSSVLTSIILEDLQDGLDTPSVIFNADTFNIDPRNERTFRPAFGFATASFYKRGTTEPITSSFKVFPSMSINKDYVPEYWFYYTTQSTDKTISVVGRDENKNIIDSLPTTAYVGQANKQSKNLTITFTYTEPYTSASISVDKTFSIVPDGKPGDETIIFEVTPAAVALKANAKGVVNSYSSSVTEIRLKQGSRYLKYTASKGEGTFFIVADKISSKDITPGNIINPLPPGFNKDYTGSLFIGSAKNLINLSGSVTYDVEIQPYYTSSIYTASIVQNFTKVLDGAPQLEVILNPINPTIISNEVGYITDYTAADTILKIKEGDDYLLYNSMSFAPGTFWVEDFTQRDIKTASLDAVYNTDNALIKFHKFDYPYVSASVDYHIVAYPYSLGPGHTYTSSVFSKTQTFSKSVTPAKARGVSISATSNIVNYDSDGQTVSPAGDIILTAVATNTTGSVYYQFFKDNIAYTGIQSSATATVASADAAAPGETATWKVKIRDGNNLVATPVRAEAELTIAGIQEGVKAYNAALTNEVSSPVYKVSGEFNLSGTGTSITATKGNESLTHVSTFSAQTLDNFGNEIGSLGEYKVTIHSKSGHITLAGGLTTGGTVPTVGGIATIGQLTGWTDPNTNTTATIVYKVDFENNKAVYYKTQSLAVQFEGATGPGIVMRGVWKNSTNYIGAVETTNNRRDAVIWPDPAGYNNETHYWAAVSGSGPSTYVNPTTSTFYVGGSPPGGYNLIGAQQPDNGGSTPPWVDSEYWKYLGQEEFFVAAKIAIFEESFVKNTINVGNDAGSAYANVVIAGGRTDPYIAIGQNGTTGASGDQASAGVIGYEKEGIFLGIYENATPNGTTGRFSISNADGTKALKWDGQNLTIIGSITQVSPGQNEGSLRGAWTNGYTYYANDIVTYGGQSWQCTSAISHVANSSGGASNGVPGVGPWVVAAAAGTSGTSGTQGPPGVNGSSGTSGVNGADGGTGPGIVFRGKWTEGAIYYKDNTINRVDVVQSNIDNLYYLAKSTHTAASGQEPSGGSGISGTPATYWNSFGTQFSSVATGILLAENATITVGLTIGQAGSPTGFIRSVNASSITAGNGFYLDNGGSVRVGTDTTDPSPKYIYFNRSAGTLTIKGSVTIDDGSIGNWVVESGGNIRDTNSRIILNPNIPEIQMYDSTGLKKLSLNPSDSLTSLGGSDLSPSWTSGMPPSFGSTNSSVTTTNDGFTAFGNNVYSNISDTINVAVGRTGVYTVTIDSIPTLNVTSTGFPTATGTTGDPTTTGYPVPYTGAVYSATPSRATFTLGIYFEVLNSSNVVIHTEFLNAGYAYGPYQRPRYWYSTNGTTWNNFVAAQPDEGAYADNPTAGTKTFTVNFPTAGNYYCRYRLTAFGTSAINSSLNSYGINTITYTTFTKAHNETDNLDGFFTFVYPSNFTEVASGGTQIVSSTDQYVKIKRYAPGSPINSQIIETKGGVNYLGQSVANRDNSTLYVYGRSDLNGMAVLGDSWQFDTTKPFYTYLKGGLVYDAGIGGAIVAPGSAASPTALFTPISAGQTIIFVRKSGTNDRYALPFYVDATNNSAGYDIIQRGHKLIIFNLDDGPSCYIKGLLIGPTSWVEIQGGACWTLFYLGSTDAYSPTRDSCWVLTSTYDNTW